MGKIYKATKKAFYKNRQIDVGDEVEFTPNKGQGLPSWLLQRDKFGKPTNQIEFTPLEKVRPGAIKVVKDGITSADVQKEYNKAKAEIDKQLTDLQEQRAAFEVEKEEFEKEKEAWQEQFKDVADAEPETESTDVEESEEVEESEPDDSGFVYTKEAPATTKAKAKAAPKAKGGAKKAAASKDEEIF